MREDLLRQLAAELNKVPAAADRAPRVAALVAENNTRIATEAVTNMSFDSSPYAYQAWLAAVDKN
jgi:hypothetical protein